MGPFACISLDCPWLERGGGKIKRGADRHYPLMKPHEIIETIIRAPVWHVAPNAHLWSWVTDNHYDDGRLVMAALGFRYIRSMAWNKDRIGIGQYLRGKHELCLLGVRGRLPAQRRDQPSSFTAPRGRHSAKPQEAYDIIEAVSPGPRLEMFATQTAGGMDDMGERTVDEVTMRWKRLAPGHYQLHIDESTIVAVIERSSVANSWWWRAWDWETEGFGYDRTLRAAKENAIAARSRQKLKVV